MGRIRPSHILAVMALASPIASANIPQYDSLFARASTCANTSDTKCPGVPSNFCCPTNTKCLVLASNTTVLCCPEGATCALIQPIVCDVSQQNATAFPGATIKTTNLSGTLQTCGTQCCPFGYSCNTDKLCALNPDQGTSPSQTGLATTASSTPTMTVGDPSSATVSPSDSTTSTTSSSTPNKTPIPLTGDNTPSSSTCTAFPARAIIAGFFPGLALGALLAILTICLIGAHRNKRASSTYTRRPHSNGSSTFGKVAASISDPIYHDTGAMRTDFIRKAPATPQSSIARQPTIQRVRSLFRKSAATTSSSHDGNPSVNINRYFHSNTSPAPPVPLVPRPPVTPRTPRTPKLQREPSGESINIFTDPSTARSMDHDRDRAVVRASGQTTFTDMMERADLGGMRRGEGFVETPTPGPGRGENRWR